MAKAPQPFVEEDANTTPSVGTAADAVGGKDPNAGDVKPPQSQAPKRPGTEMSMVVRKNGWLWQWNGDDWVSWRLVKPADKRKYPRASKVLGGEPADAEYGGDEPADIPDWAVTPAQPADTDAAPATATPTPATPVAAEPGELRGIPGGSKLWNVDGEWWLIYNTPRLGSNEPLLLGYKVRDGEELEAITGSANPDADRTLNNKRGLDRLGVIRAGRANELADLGDHPMDALKDTWREEAAIRPWLNDPEMLGITVEAHLEGRAVTDAEMMGTQWWQSRTPAERQWAQFVAENGGAQSPAVQQAVNDARGDVERRMVAAGLNLPGPAGRRVLNYLTREFVNGRLTEAALQRTIETEANPYRTGATPTAGFAELPDGAERVRFQGRTYIRWNGKDFALAKGMETAKYGAGARRVDEINPAQRPARDIIANRGGAPQGRAAVEGIERVRGLIREWIGPQLMDGWAESDIAQWAQRIAENPNDENVLVAKLRSIRAARYQGYDDELTYEDIARIGRAQVMDVLGTTIDEREPIFQQVLQMNDATQAGQALWDYGFEKGNRRVAAQALRGMYDHMSGGVMPSQV